MPKRVEPLSPSAVANAKPKATSYVLRDGRGLLLLVEPNGSKLWRLDYRRPDTGKRNTLSLGAYPEVTLKRAREKRDEARALLSEDIDPAAQRVAQKRAGAARAANSFEVVAREWLETKGREWGEANATRNLAWLKQHVFPVIGARPIEELDAPELLEMLRKLVKRGTLNTAERVRAMLSTILRFAIATGRVKRDCAADLRGALPSSTKRHFASLTEPNDVAALLRAIEGYQGSPITFAALRLAPMLFQRPGELRAAEWTEIELEKAEWRIPAARQKLTRAAKENPRTPPHIVPLPKQALAILRELQELTGAGRYLFPGLRTPTRPMSENTVNAALRRLGYTKEQMTSHGFRHMASTRLNEMSLWNPDAIEAALSHKMPGVRGVYAGRANFLDERRRMMQAWADYLDALRTNSNVVPIGRRVRK